MVEADSIASAKATTTVLVIPFDVETYIPVTVSTIECNAWERWTITDRDQARRLIALLTQGDSAFFDSQRVRVAVLQGASRYYVDTNGVVLDGIVSHRLDRKTFQQLGEELTPGQRQRLIEQSRGLHCR